MGTVRDGIRLICDLRAGRLDVLLELFPWVQAAVIDSLSPSPSFGQAELNKRLADLERLLLAQDGRRVIDPAQAQAGPKPLVIGSKSSALPPDDDDEDDLLVVRKSKAIGNSAQAFVDQCFDFVGQ